MSRGDWVQLCWLLVAALTGFVFWVLKLHRLSKTDARRDAEVFINMFPGRCLPCAYHRYGVSNGFVEPTEPVPVHRCAEVKP